MEHIGIYHREGGVGAQTGTVVHKGVQAWHLTESEDSAIGEMDGMRGDYPLADYSDAERLFHRYIADPRNIQAKIAVHAGTPLLEVLLQGEIAPGIFLAGTCDQIRAEAEGWQVWDLKTSKEAGTKIKDQHTFQLAAYAYLATKRFKRPVLPGGIIMARGYPKADKVWFPYTLTMEDVNNLMTMVVDRVRDVRAGRLQVVPGEYCQYCIGVSSCLPKVRGWLSG